MDAGDSIGLVAERHAAPDPMVTRASRQAQAIPDRADAIPSIDLAIVYGRRFDHDDIQYATLCTLAELMGHQPAPHRHDGFLQIHFIEQGRFSLSLDTQHYEGSGPALFLTPPTVPHAFTLDKHTRGHVLTVRQNLIWDMARADPTLPGQEKLDPFCVELRTPQSRRIARELAMCFRLLQREMGNGQPGNRTIAEALTRTIVAQALRVPQKADSGLSHQDRDLAIYRRFLQLVENHFREHWAVSRFAQALGITEWRLHEIAHICANTTPKAILRHRLMQEAKRQLAFSEASIKEVADVLGFSDSPYFCRFFKRLSGQTPSDYRIEVRYPSTFPEKSNSFQAGAIEGVPLPVHRTST